MGKVAVFDDYQFIACTDILAIECKISKMLPSYRGYSYALVNQEWIVSQTPRLALLAQTASKAELLEGSQNGFEGVSDQTQSTND